jgi:hypothetical protein
MRKRRTRVVKRIEVKAVMEIPRQRRVATYIGLTSPLRRVLYLRLKGIG